MQVDIYKIHHTKWRYIVVPAGSNIESIIDSLPGFHQCPFTTYRRIQRAHDTFSQDSTLNSDVVRDDLRNNGYRFVHKIRKL
nr:MAG TPA_asm: hypothetical protein [Caudoviricetes sp.]